MEFFYWNKTFELGIESVDRQHRRLVDLLNSLASAIGDGTPLPEVRDLFGTLLDYAGTHFADEERLLDRCPLPEPAKEKHRQAHRDFVAWVEHVSEWDLRRAEAGRGVLDFLVAWLVSHILGADQAIAEAMDGGRKPVVVQGSLSISPVAQVLVGALTETERRFRMISDSTPVLIWVADAAGTRGFMNRAWSEFVEGDIEECGERWRECVHPDDVPAYLRLLQSLSGDPHSAEVRYRLRDRSGRYRWFLERILPRVNDRGEPMGLIASATDISSLMDAELMMSRANQGLEQEVARRTAQLEQLMLTDPLTGIGNRRYLMARLTEEVARAERYRRPLCAAFLDIDHFKRVNDTLGHACGDQVLVQTAAVLKHGLRESDLLGRLGGEEFVVLLPETSLDYAIAAGERWRASVAGLAIEGIPWPVTASVGVAQLNPGEGGESLLRRCDEAMYLAKSEGRNCVRTMGGTGAVCAASGAL